jgi:hypothetical protein
MGVADCIHGLLACYAGWFRPIITFVRYIVYLTKRRSMSLQDLKISLALYFIYPALLWLFLNVFHGFCGMDTYTEKVEAIQACQHIYIWFCFLMRSYKLVVLHVYGVEKQGSDRNLGRRVADAEQPRGLKCRTWFHLSHEMALVGWVIFLLLICLPVLAFWSMFLSILVSSWNVFMLLRRLWRTAQSREANLSTQAGDTADAGDEELQNFLPSSENKDLGF